MAFALRAATCALCFTLLATPSPAQSHKLVVISIAGLDARYLNEADRLHLKIPVLRRLMRQGAVADGVTTVMPGDGWAAHTSILTGVAPSQHGILTAASPVAVPHSRTLWQAAADAHLKTASIYWPATVNASIDFNCPEYWETSEAADLPFDPIAQKCTPGLVQRISSVYPGFSKTLWNDATAVDALLYLLQYEQPDLMLVRLADLEAEEHETGALSIYSREILENQDEWLGQTLAKLPAHSLVAIVSDHGFENEDYIVRPRVLINSSAVEVRDGLIGATDARAAAALRKLLGVRRTGIAREIPMSEVLRVSPELANWKAAFGTFPNYIPSQSARGSAVGPGNHKGVSGLWPLRPNYRAAFVLWGDGVKPGRLGEVSMLDLAPTFASILDVSLPSAGHSLWPKASGAVPSVATQTKTHAK